METTTKRQQIIQWYLQEIGHMIAGILPSEGKYILYRLIFELNTPHFVNTTKISLYLSVFYYFR